jgi:enediyne biosynthesis protein E4
VADIDRNKFKYILLLSFIAVAGYLWFENHQGSKLKSINPNAISLVDITEEAGLHTHLRPKIHNENPAYLEVMGGGVAVGDIDGNGYEDIFFVTMPSFHPEEREGGEEFRSALFKNSGDGTFEEITDQAGLGDISGYPMGALFFDFNNNGMQDLYVASYGGGQLFRNEGGYFVDITESAGLSLDGLCGNYPCMAAAASAADYNRSGYLDLVIINNVDWDIHDPDGYGSMAMLPQKYRAQQTFLFQNNGDGTFTNVSQDSGITNLDSRGYMEDGKGLSAVWTDLNNNGWPDLFIANDMTPNRLYLNNRDGTFTDIAISARVDELKSNMGIDTADFNYNGYLDLVSTNLEGDMTTLFRNYGDLRYDYATIYSGLLSSGWSSGWGILFVDLNLNGHLDLVMASGALWEGRMKERENENIFFRNLGNGNFSNVNDNTIRFDNDQISRGSAIIDIHRNGRPDLIISNLDGVRSQLLANTTENHHNWIRLDLEGTISNRDAVGARVYLERSDGLIQNQLLKAGNSYQSSGSKSLFFGLGTSDIRELKIEWPSGETDIFDDVPINRIVHIREGQNEIIDQTVRPEQAGL